MYKISTTTFSYRLSCDSQASGFKMATLNRQRTLALQQGAGAIDDKSTIEPKAKLIAIKFRQRPVCGSSKRQQPHRPQVSAIG
jgi:hypothetical protein